MVSPTRPPPYKQCQPPSTLPHLPLLWGEFSVFSLRFQIYISILSHTSGTMELRKSESIDMNFKLALFRERERTV